MNDTSHSYLDSGKGTFSSIDFSLCYPSLFLDFDWSVCEDQHGSDHFPIVIESIQTPAENHNPKWKLNKANRDLFHFLCDQTITPSPLSDSVDPVVDFTSSLSAISEKRIPKTSTSSKKSNPLYNEDCKEATKERKQALSKFCKYPTKENLDNAKARRTIKSAKRKSWRTYVSKLNYKTPIKNVWDMMSYIYMDLLFQLLMKRNFLRVIFDRKLSFIPHIKYKSKCLKALNLLEVLSHTSWGADRTIFLHLYRSLIRSKLVYGAIVYGSARKSYLAMLDTVHHQGLRLAL